MVARYISVLASTRVNRSITCRFFDDPRKLTWSLKLVVSTTSVSPSQCPTESPSHCRMFSGRCGSVHADDARVVDHLHQNHDGVLGLDDLVVVVVQHRQHGRPGAGAETHQAALRQRPVLHRIGSAAAAPHGRKSLARFGRQWRNPAVRRIDNQRAALHAIHPRQLRPAIDEERVVTARVARTGPAMKLALGLAVAGLQLLVLRLLVARRFLIGDVQFPREHRRPLHRCQRRVGPNALQVGMAVPQTRHFRTPALDGRARRRLSGKRRGSSPPARRSTSKI